MWLLRALFVVAGLTLWFLTQKLIGSRGFPGGGIYDHIHARTERLNLALRNNRKLANALLISSSLGIDFLGIYLLWQSIFGPSIAPFVGLLILFALRQISQFANSLPPPEGMIWHNPGFPSLLVTYGVSNDLFFSGHTALAIFGSLMLAESGSLPLLYLGIFLAIFEITTVLILRAHWTMDVFAGAVTAVLVYLLVPHIAPEIDLFLTYCLSLIA